MRLVAMLFAWNRFDDFMALLNRADLSSVAQALRDRYDRLAVASVIEGEAVVTEPGRTSAAPEAVAEPPPGDCIEALTEASPPTAPEVVSETATIYPVEATAEAAPALPHAAVGSSVAELGPPVLPGAVAERTQGGGEAEAAAMPARAATGDDVATTAEAAPKGAVALPSGGISAEGLMANWSPLKPNTRLCGRQWVEDGCPEGRRPEEHHVITESLLHFRGLARSANESERQRFLEISTPRAP
jgi:hypothetical protein